MIITKNTIRLKQIARGLDVPKKVMTDMMLDARSDMISNTKAGKDVHNAGFSGYAELTKNKRREFGKQTGHVDLTYGINKKGRAVSGGMLTQLAVSSKVNNGYVYFIDKVKALLGLRHQTGAGKLPKREWFGWNRDMEKKAFARFWRYVKKVAK